MREKTVGFWHSFTSLLGARRDASPINNVAALEAFIASRAAFVAQKTLYGYAKARMGLHYVSMFEDANMIASLNIAKAHVFAACLSDLSVYAVANAVHRRAVANESSMVLARRCYAAAMRAYAGDAPAEFSAQESLDEFERRLTETDWQHGARESDIAFSQSPAALVRWAPIADSLKKYDTEIIGNSVKFSWREVREQFGKRLDAAAVAADWARQSD